jgi:prevent-host-death family protein
MESVGAYEAKTHLPRLLEAVATGKSVVITKHGIPVAKLVPAHRQGPQPGEVIDSLRQARSGVTLGGMSLADLVSEGRR